jgi:hypothetical protein
MTLFVYRPSELSRSSKRFSPTFLEHMDQPEKEKA